MLIDLQPKPGLDNFDIEPFQSADALWMILSELDFGLCEDSCIEDDSHIYQTLYFRKIITCIRSRLAHCQFHEHLNVRLVRLPCTNSRGLCREIIKGDWWWEIQDQLPTRGTIMPVFGAPNWTHLTNFSGDQHTWLLNLTICNIWEDVCWTPKERLYFRSADPMTSKMWQTC